MRINTQNKLLAGFLALIIISVSTLGIFCYRKARDILLEEMKSSSLNSIENANNYFVAHYLKEVENSLSLLANKPELFKSIANGNFEATDQAWSNLLQLNSHISYIYFADLKGNIHLLPDWNPSLNYEPSTRPWHQTAIQQPGKIVWSQFYQEPVSATMVVSAVIAITDGNKTLGVLGIETPVNELAKLVENINFQGQGYAVLLDQKGTIIAHPVKNLIGKNVSAESWFQQLTDTERGAGLQSLNGLTTLVSHLTIPQTNWKLVSFTPKPALEKEIVPIRIRTIFVIMITSLVAFILTAYTSLKNTSKINVLIDTMSKVEAGDFAARYCCQGSDEFIDLGEKFNQMVLGFERLISEHKKTEQELEVQKTYFQQLFENSPESIVILDNQDRVVKINKQFEQFFLYKPEEIIGKPINDLIVPEELYAEAIAFSKDALNGIIIKGESVRKQKDGNLANVSILAYPIIINGSLSGIYAIYRDITQRKVTEKQLKYFSFHDILTGVYNRTCFEREMRRLEKNFRDSAAIIIYDLDGLKLVNDTLGHNAGDRLLKDAAAIIKEFLPPRSLFRIGGDEFAAIIENAIEAEIEKICAEIRKAIDKYNESDAEFPLSISIGFALKNSPLISINDVFKNADNNMYREKLQRSQSTRSTIVKTLLKALEARDFITEGHSERLQSLTEGTGRAIGLTEQQIVDLRLFSQFHDLGKVGIPDRILFKPGPLTKEEMEEMKRHSEIGYRIAIASGDLNHIADWILKHHEWWNGKGYPLGLKKEEIPIQCRILAIADAYDAMTNDRPYRKALTHEDALKELQKSAGIHFEPHLVEVFIQYISKLNQNNAANK